jgi:hypothetical protein
VSSQGRKRLAAAKLRLIELRSLPNINELIAQKPKWKHRKRHQALCNQVQALEAKAKQTRFRKEIDIRTFAYHVEKYHRVGRRLGQKLDHPPA